MHTFLAGYYGFILAEIDTVSVVTITVMHATVIMNISKFSYQLHNNKTGILMLCNELLEVQVH
ncbi:hypothetical protein VIBNISOn1_1480009 [Vibrio nigripulchritudo SOn1]|uniref:Uncharacterized protein n=1 Tax=Vibrio nigripulchritudo SOn1 TaxID=1238450 RepID=A0AAV2VLD3_9VIBR|nr:hypothetical protein VIBNISOn1_1480009 [Vibrio nigripulchritudo SOn1]